jgi:hypothetical protein
MFCGVLNRKRLHQWNWIELHWLSAFSKFKTYFIVFEFSFQHYSTHNLLTWSQPLNQSTNQSECSEESARPLYGSARIRGNPNKWFVVTKTCLPKCWLLSNRGSTVDWRMCLPKRCLADGHIPSQYLPYRICMKRCFGLTRQAVAYKSGDIPGRSFGGN